MSRLNDTQYFTARALEEMERADQSPDARVAAVHHEMAHRYSSLSRAATSDSPLLTVIPSSTNSIAG